MGWKPVAAGMLLAAVVLGACDNSTAERQPDQPSKDPATTKLEELQDPDAKPPAPPVEGAETGGTLTVLTRQVPETFDPTRSAYVDTTMVLRLVTRALTQYRYDPKTQQMVLVPDLATDLGRPNEDYTEWTYTLREGVRYETGEPVTSADVAYAIRRQFAQEELGGGPLYGQDYFLGGEEYAGPFKAESEGGGADFAGVETPDERTVVIRMRRPFPEMMYYASFPNFAPIPEAEDTGSDYGNAPVATGPYRFEHYEPGERLVLTRNEEWDPQTDPGRNAYPDEFVFEFGQDPVELQERLISDDEKATTSATYDDLLAEILPTVTKRDAMDRVVRADRSCVFYAYMDMRTMPLEVRRALALAYPIEELNEAAGYIPGLTAVPATTILPSTIPGWKEHDAIGRGGEGPPRYEEARKILADAGYEGFEIVTYVASDDPIQQRVARVREDELEKAGFRVKSVGVPSAKLRQRMGDPKAPVNLRTEGWCADWPSGSSVLPAQWDPRNTGQPGAPNPSFIEAPEIAAEIDRIFDLPPEKAMGEWAKLDKRLMSEYLPVIPLSQSGAALLHGSNVGNYRVDDVLGMPDLAQVYLTGE